MKEKNLIFKKHSLGFTLLELLVVISIIGILLALGVVAFSTAQQKARDAKRRGDIKALHNGFEQYYALNNGSYGSCADMRNSDNLPAGVSEEIFPGGAPTDPKTGNAYDCDDANSSYCVCATLETGGGNGGDNPCPVEGGITGHNDANSLEFLLP